MDNRRSTCGQRVLQAATLLGALVPATVMAAPYLPTVTGERFVHDMLATQDSDQAAFRRERMIGYMDGVLDGTAGVRWCPAGSEVAHELSFVAAEEMKKLAPAQLKGSAASLILVVLSRLYPCSKLGVAS